MKKKNTNLLAQASTKSDESLILEQCLPMLDLILELKPDIEALSADLGVKIMHRYMEQEIQRRCGPWGQQSHHRHGTQPGYVIFHGRKVPLERPRLRQKAGGVALTVLGFNNPPIPQLKMTPVEILRAVTLMVRLDGFSLARVLESHAAIFKIYDTCKPAAFGPKEADFMANSLKIGVDQLDRIFKRRKFYKKELQLDDSVQSYIKFVLKDTRKCLVRLRKHVKKRPVKPQPARSHQRPFEGTHYKPQPYQVGHYS